MRALVLIVASRALSTAVALAVSAAILHEITVGRDPLPVVVATLGLFGVTLVLASILRERGTVRQSSGLVAIVIVGWVAWGLAQPARAPDLLATLTRLVGFGILGEVHLWRTLGIARGAQRWRDVRNDSLLALGAVVIAALVGSVDHDPLPALGLAVACTGAVALSLARSVEELTLSSGQIRGRAGASSATGTAFALGLLAIALAVALPSLEALVAAAARALGPVVSQVLFIVLLPLGYLAAYLVNVALWLRDHLHFTPIQIQLPTTPFVPGDDAERLREMEQIRPYVFGAVELLVALVAVAFALALVARLVQERRERLAEGASIERENVPGIGLGATLRGLFTARPARPRRPAEDGTSAASVRVLYWRLLELAERDGPGWRAPSETPAEHEARLVSASGRWRAAAPIVRAFESLRYGELDPDATTLEHARDALRVLEAAR